MALLTTQNIVTAGIAVTYSAVAASDTVVPGVTDFIHVKNGGGSPTTVTITTPGTVDGLAIADRAVVVTNATEKMIKIPAEFYRDPATGLATVTCSPTTSVTIAALRV